MLEQPNPCALVLKVMVKHQTKRNQLSVQPGLNNLRANTIKNCMQSMCISVILCMGDMLIPTNNQCGEQIQRQVTFIVMVTK